MEGNSDGVCEGDLVGNELGEEEGNLDGELLGCFDADGFALLMNDG